MRQLCLLILLFNFGCSFVAGQNTKAQLLLFWSETCPNCIFYGPEIRRLQGKYIETVEWIFIFPNLTSTDSTAHTYILKNKLQGKIEVARAADYVQKYKIEVTPEVVLLDPAGALLYAGRIDNSYEKIGRRRFKTTETELADRLQKLADYQSFPYIRTRSVGCFLH